MDTQRQQIPLDEQFVKNLKSQINLMNEELNKYEAIKITNLNSFPLGIYILSAMMCFIGSTLFHLFMPVSLKVCQFVQRLDMSGISILIFGSVYASHYYFFYCNGWLRHTYSWISFIICFAVFLATLLEYFHKPENLAIKGKLFGALGIINGITFVHWVFAGYVANEQNSFIPLNRSYLGIVIMGIFYLTGLAFYIKQFPECKCPGKFDIVGQSHSIFHLFVFLAAFIYYVTLYRFYEQRSDIMCHNHQIIVKHWFKHF